MATDTQKKVTGLVLTSAMALVIGFEGFSDRVYIPVPGDAPTACYGHRDPLLRLGEKVTMVQCQGYLNKDVAAAQATIKRYVKVPLNRNEWDAWTSFIYNTGPTTFHTSHALLLLNAGDHAGACKQMPRFHYSNHVSIRGLVIRRAKEEAVCLTPSKEIAYDYPGSN